MSSSPLIFAVAMIATALGAPYARGAGFDCSKAVIESDRAICATPELSARDDELTRVFNEVKTPSNAAALLAEERQWLAMRKTCGGDQMCLNVWYDQRIAALKQMLKNAPVGAAPPSPEQKLACEVGGTFMVLTPTECADSNARLRAERQLQQQKADREASEQAATINAQRQEVQKKYAAALAAQIKNQEEKGYKAIQFDDFQLDGKELASADAKLAIHGLYIKLGEVEFIMPSIIAIQMVREMGRAEEGIGLLTDDAPRPLRQYFLNCRNSPAQSQLGCEITILGRATICERTTIVGKSTVPCLVVEDGWRVPAP